MNETVTTPGDTITTRKGRSVGSWDGRNAQSLLDELARIRTLLHDEGRGDRLSPAGVPHNDQLPEDLRRFRAYPIWGCDRNEICVCGANANRLVAVADIRQFSLIDHH